MSLSSLVDVPLLAPLLLFCVISVFFLALPVFVLLPILGRLRERIYRVHAAYSRALLKLTLRPNWRGPYVIVGGLLILGWLGCGIPAVVKAVGENEYPWIPDGALEVAYRLGSYLVPNPETENPRPVPTAQDGAAHEGVVLQPVQRGLSRLELMARTFGFAATLWFALPAFLLFLINQSQGMVAALVRRHYVIIGLGQAGRALIKDVDKRRGSPLAVVLETQVDAASRREARSSGALVLPGDGRNTADLQRLSIRHAERIFIATGSEGTNLEVAFIVRDLLEHLTSSQQFPTIHPLLNNPVLLQRIDTDARLFLGDGDAKSPRIKPFSSDQIATLRLFEQYPIPYLSWLQPVQRAHFVIVGINGVGEDVVRQGLQMGLYPGLRPPRITIIYDTREVAEGAPEALFRRRFPRLFAENDGSGGVSAISIDLRFEGYDFTFIGEEILDLAERPTFDDSASGVTPLALARGEVDWPESEVSLDPVTAVFVCTTDDEDSLATALALQHLSTRYQRWLAPFFVRLARESGLKRSLEPFDGCIELSIALDDFGQDDQVCTVEEVFERARAKQAEPVHQGYDVDTAARPTPHLRATAKGPAEQLAQTYVRATAAQAAHIGAKLYGLGYRPEQLSCGRRNLERAEVVGRWPLSEREATSSLLARWRKHGAFPPVLEVLSKVEHRRWMVERFSNGWRHARARDNGRQHHPMLVDWDVEPFASHEDKDKDRAHVLKLNRLTAFSPRTTRWLPELSIGIVAPPCALSDGVGACFEKRVVDYLQETIRDFRSTWSPFPLQEGPDTGARCERETGLGAGDPMALTVVSSLRPGPELMFAEIAQKWVSERRCSGNLAQFRLLVPKATRGGLRIQPREATFEKWLQQQRGALAEATSAGVQSVLEQIRNIEFYSRGSLDYLGESSDHAAHWLDYLARRERLIAGSDSCQSMGRLSAAAYAEWWAVEMLPPGIALGDTVPESDTDGDESWRAVRKHGDERAAAYVAQKARALLVVDSPQASYCAGAVAWREWMVQKAASGDNAGPPPNRAFRLPSVQGWWRAATIYRLPASS